MARCIAISVFTFDCSHIDVLGTWELLCFLLNITVHIGIRHIICIWPIEGLKIYSYY